MKANTTLIAKRLARKNNISELQARKLVVSVMESIQDLVSEGYRDLDLYGVATLSFKVETPTKFFNVVTKKVENGKPRIRTSVKVKRSMKERLRKDNVLAKLF